MYIPGGRPRLRHRRQLLTVLLVVVTSLIILSLGTTQVALGAKVKLTWLSAMWEINDQFHRDMVAEFNAMQDEIEVELETIASNSQQAEAVLLRVAAGTPPDIVDFHPNYFYNIAKEGILLNLSPVLAQDPDFNLNDFYKPVLDSLTVDGKLYGIPQRISYYNLYYNADFFSAAGLPFPAVNWFDPNWTWETYRQAAGKLSRDTNGDGVFDVVGSVFSTATGQIVSWLAQGGARLFDDNYTELTLDTQAGINTLRYLADLITSGVSRTGSWNDFVAGKAAMLHETPAVAQLIRDANFFYAWDVAAFPQGPAGPATALQPVPYAIVASSNHLEEAVVFFKYFFSREMSMRQSAAGITVQPRRSVVTSSSFRTQLGVKNADAILQALDVAVPIPSHNRNFVAINSAIKSMLGKVFKGEVAPHLAVEGIKSQVAALLAEGK